MGFLDDLKAEKQKKVAENWFKFAERTAEPEKKIEYYTRALEADPLNSSIWTAKGKVLEKLGRAGEAEECFAKSRENEPSSGFSPAIETVDFEETKFTEKYESPDGEEAEKAEKEEEEEEGKEGEEEEAGFTGPALQEWPVGSETATGNETNGHESAEAQEIGLEKFGEEEEEEEEGEGEEKVKREEKEPPENFPIRVPESPIKLENEPAGTPEKVKKADIGMTGFKMPEPEKIPVEEKPYQETDAVKKEAGMNFSPGTWPERDNNPRENRDYTHDGSHDYAPRDSPAHAGENYVNIRISWGEAIKFWLAGAIAMILVWLVVFALFSSLIGAALLGR